MQIKNNRPNNLQNPWIIGLLKVLLLGGCIYFLSLKLHDQPVSFNDVVISDGFVLTLIGVLLLMVVNWYLEALRWKVSLKSFEPITMNQSWQVVLGGLALNWVFPFTSGDLLARISQQRDKYQATSAALLNRGIMLVFTLVLGLYGISHMAQAYDFNGWFLLGILLGVPLIRRLFKSKIERFMTYFRELTKGVLFQVVCISLLRYAIFVFQFYLLLEAFLPLLDTSLIIAGIGWVFLVRSVLPLFFGGVGVREASGILFFEPLVNDVQLIIAPIFLIWVINTVIPSLVGLIFILRMKPIAN